MRDVVRAYRLLVEHGEPGEVYNVCSGRDVAVQELADDLLAMARRPMRFEPDPELLRPVDVPVLRGDHARLTKATGWEPEIPLAQTLTDLLDDWRTRCVRLSGTWSPPWRGNGPENVSRARRCGRSPGRRRRRRRGVGRLGRPGRRTPCETLAAAQRVEGSSTGSFEHGER